MNITRRSFQQIREAIAAMKRQHIPPNKNGDYIVFAHPSYLKDLRG